jgi:general secretion pathway protein A
MSYFKVLGFEKEPFSTSPDPEFFYLSKEHELALTNILIEIRLKRGLAVILGDVGTGKTSLSRKLIQELKERQDIIFHIILDPSFENEYLFLTSLTRNFDINNIGAYGVVPTILDLRESLERFLFQKGVAENKSVTIIIDEAQKLSNTSLELLRILLGQVELHSKIMNIPNFFDRISFKYTLNPLDFSETKEMIGFRIKKAGYSSPMNLFLDDAIREIHQHSRGYPRQITLMCHRALKCLVMKNKFVVDARLVHELIEEDIRTGWYRKDPLLQRSNYLV